MPSLLSRLTGGGNAEGQRAIWYSTNNKVVSIDWRDQISCKQFEFCLPWKMAGWQPSSIQPTGLPADAVPKAQKPNLLETQGCLHQLTQRSRDEIPVPDGLVSIALYTFVTALGCGMRPTRFIIADCIRAQLQAVCSLTRTRWMRVAEFL